MTGYPFPVFTNLMGTAMPPTYTFPAASNNGKISSTTEGISGETVTYPYDSRNQRVWSATIAGGYMTQQVSFFGVDGQKLGGYLLQVVAVNNQVAAVADSGSALAVFFAGKRIGLTSGGSTTAFTQDRLGSNGSYYPYGEARGTVPQDQVGFATYTNDSATGLQYADQRYYANNWGRFMSPDPRGLYTSPPDDGGSVTCVLSRIV